ncbi:hypothetical protein KCU81_g173, partial [Aureobasidium melanogenum]
MSGRLFWPWVPQAKIVFEPRSRNRKLTTGRATRSTSSYPARNIEGSRDCGRLSVGGLGRKGFGSRYPEQRTRLYVTAVEVQMTSVRNTLLGVGRVALSPPMICWLEGCSSETSPDWRIFLLWMLKSCLFFIIDRRLFIHGELLFVALGPCFTCTIITERPVVNLVLVLVLVPLRIWRLRMNLAASEPCETVSALGGTLVFLDNISAISKLTLANFRSDLVAVFTVFDETLWVWFRVLIVLVIIVLVFFVQIVPHADKILTRLCVLRQLINQGGVKTLRALAIVLGVMPVFG